MKRAPGLQPLHLARPWTSVTVAFPSIRSSLLARLVNSSSPLFTHSRSALAKISYRSDFNRRCLRSPQRGSLSVPPRSWCKNSSFRVLFLLCNCWRALRLSSHACLSSVCNHLKSLVRVSSRRVSCRYFKPRFFKKAQNPPELNSVES